MGQTQLILLTLGVVIVAVSVMTGISMFSEKRDQALFDSMIGEANSLAGHLVAWKAKPSAFGGGQSAAYLTGFDWGAVGITETNGAGNKANNDQFFRTVNGSTTKRPVLVLRSKDNVDVRVQLYMYGPGSNCFKIRTGRRIDGSWVNSGTPVGKNNPPDECSVW